MKTEISTLCEYASDNNGRLTIVDAFDAIVADKLPWRSYFYFAAKWNMDGNSIEYKKMTISIVPDEADAKPIFETSGPFEKIEEVSKLNFAAGLKGLIFEKAGDYYFRIKFDDEIATDHKFKVLVSKNEKN